MDEATEETENGPSLREVRDQRETGEVVGFRGLSLRYRIRVLVLYALAILCTMAGVSYVSTLAAPGNASLTVRTVDWLRNYHVGFVVALGEDVWYTINQPRQGGPSPRALPNQPASSRVPASRPSVSHHDPASKKVVDSPANVRPLISPSLPREGVWAPVGQPLDGSYPIRTTTLRPDPFHPSVVAGLAWIDTSRTHLALVPGLEEPESHLGPGPGKVPSRDKSSLLATFNSGFKTRDGKGGFAANGKTYVRPGYGLGTIVVYQDGQVRIGAWGTEIKPSPKIAYLRQNLPLLVDDGTVSSFVNSPWPWVPETVANNVMVWRSGIGIDANGDLIYTDGSSLTESGLANLLRHAGAVKAMALDENAFRTDFFTYSAPGGAGASKLLPSMPNPTSRYLVADRRDFFMVTK